jgi:uncharacterized protein (TIGR00730 family)
LELVFISSVLLFGSSVLRRGFVKALKRICVFCGSSFGARPAYKQAAEQLGKTLAHRGLGLVYGGGGVGLMGAIADAALAAGGEVIGVIPESLQRREVGHSGLTKLHVVRSMHERKALMADLADAFIALPGGFGTMEEFCEIVTWSQLGIQHKPCGLLNVEGYWDHFLAMLDHSVDEKFVRPENSELILVARNPDSMLERLMEWEPPPQVEKWVDGTKR